MDSGSTAVAQKRESKQCTSYLVVSCVVNLLFLGVCVFSISGFEIENEYVNKINLKLN